MLLEAREATPDAKDFLVTQTLPNTSILVFPETPQRYKRLEDVVLGGRRFRIPVLHEVTLKDTSHSLWVLQWLKGYQPLLGLPIIGWQDAETVALRQTTHYELHHPRGIDYQTVVNYERDLRIVRSLLVSMDIPVKECPITHHAAIAYYSSANMFRPQVYPGGTKYIQG